MFSSSWGIFLFLGYLTFRKNADYTVGKGITKNDDLKNCIRLMKVRIEKI